MSRDLDRRTLLFTSAAAGVLPSGAMADEADGRRDFDFLFGHWTVRHGRLKSRLTGSTQWDEFDGVCEARPIIGGLGNVDDNLLDLPGGAYRAASIRQFDPTKRQWSIWWMDERAVGLGEPVVGRFTAGVGEFFGEDTLRDIPIRARFRWSGIGPRSAFWKQAFAPKAQPDQWETNWTMHFTRTA